jgi:hypothetical protein
MKRKKLIFYILGSSSVRAADVGPRGRGDGVVGPLVTCPPKGGGDGVAGGGDLRDLRVMRVAGEKDEHCSINEK